MRTIDKRGLGDESARARYIEPTLLALYGRSGVQRSTARIPGNRFAR